MKFNMNLKLKSIVIKLVSTILLISSIAQASSKSDPTQECIMIERQIDRSGATIRAMHYIRYPEGELSHHVDKNLATGSFSNFRLETPDTKDIPTNPAIINRLKDEINKFEAMGIRQRHTITLIPFPEKSKRQCCVIQ